VAVTLSCGRAPERTEATNEPIKLRSNAKPGWCWQDNELYDVMQPIVGAQACWIFANMTRLAYGPEVHFSLRDMGEATGWGRDTVWRALRLMEATGMIVVRRSGRNKAATYQLADLKELVISNGGEFDPKRKLYVLPPAQTQRLKDEKLRVSKAGQRKTVARSDNSDFAESDSDVALEGQCCRSMERQPLINKTQDLKTKSIKPPFHQNAAEDCADGDEVVGLPAVGHSEIERIYAVYPRQVGKAKALKAIRKPFWILDRKKTRHP
jgi:hypothetical protein